MWFFKLKTRNIVNSLLLVFVLSYQVACIRGANDNPSSPGATETSTGDFRVQTVTGQAITTSENSTWKLPTAKTYAFRLCLMSRMTNAIVPIGQKFRIVAPDKTAQEDETDELGCIDWEETIPFNYGGDSYYLERRRTIEGMGTYKGKADIRYAVNPWLEYRGDTNPEVVDLVRGNINIPEDRLIKEEATKAAMAGHFSRNKSNQLYMELNPVLDIYTVGDMRGRSVVAGSEDERLNCPEGPAPDVPAGEQYVCGSGKKVNVILQLKPFLQPLNFNQDNYKQPLNTGSFKVYVQLVANHVGESVDGVSNQKVILTPDLEPQDVEIVTDSTIEFKGLNVPLSRQVTSGQVQVLVKVVPVNSPFPILPFEGIYNTGPFDEIASKKSPTHIGAPQYPEGYNYASFLEKHTTNYNELLASGWAHRLAPVYYQNLEPRFVQVKAGETSTERTVIYRVTTKVTDGIDGKDVALQPFTIIHPDGTEEHTQTDQWGFLYWQDELPHKYYERERRILEKVSIIHGRSKRKDTFTIALNPWDEGWTFGADLRSKIMVEKQIQNQVSAEQQKPNQLMIDAFRYQTIRFRYEIDEYLTLNVKKAVVMAMDPLVQREPLRDGFYLAKIAFVKFYIYPFHNGVHLTKCQAHSTDCAGMEDAERIDGSKDRYYVRKVEEGGNARYGQYTTVVKKLLRVQAGRVTTPLEFSMRDLRMMSIRSNIMVQLETIDENRLMRDNQIEQKLIALEKEYFELNPDQMEPEDEKAFFERHGYLPSQMTEEERADYLARRAEEVQQDREYLLNFIEETREELEANRSASSELQLKRFEMADKIERGLMSGSAQALYEEYNPLISLPRVEFKETLSRARERISNMEWEMKEYWEQWTQGTWDELRKTIDNDGYAGTTPFKFENTYGNHLLPEVTFKRTYNDYLLSMQTFLVDNNLPTTINDVDEAKFRINNYTRNPVAPIVDLNLYRDKSGLPRRTFIGPCTLVLNDNMSEMRPTDTVDEKFCERIDCSEDLEVPIATLPRPDNSEFEDSEFHDSLKPFAGKHVDDIIPMHIENERRYIMEMRALSKIGKFTEDFDLTFVSLEDKPIEKYIDGCSWDDGEGTGCFTEVTKNVMKSTSFLQSINKMSTKDLVGRFFHVNPPGKLYEINIEVEKRRSSENPEVRQNALQPLWDRTKEDAGFLKSLPFFNGKDSIPMDYTPFEVIERQSPYGISVQNYIDSLQKRFYSPGMDNYHARAIEYLVNSRGRSKGLWEAPVEAGDIKSWLRDGSRSMTLEDALRICVAMTDQSYKKLMATGLVEDGPSENEYDDLSNLSKVQVYLLHSCFAGIRYLPKSGEVFFDGIHFDRRYRVKQTGKYEHKAGMNININVGIDFSVSQYNDVSSAHSQGINDAGVLGLPAAGIGAMAGAAVGNIPGAAVGALVGGVGGLFVASNTTAKADGVNMAQGQSVNAATFLVVQKADFEIDIVKHEKCLSLKFGDEFLDELNPERLGLMPKVTMKKEKVRKALQTGFFVCEGTDTEEVIKRPESYYYVTQHFTAGDMLDDVNLLNHVWLLALRGKRDFNEFIRILKAKEIGPDGEIIEEQELYDYPLSRLGRVYRQVTPTFPGLYSVRE